MIKRNYEAPLLELLTLDVERGFAQSGDIFSDSFEALDYSDYTQFE